MKRVVGLTLLSVALAGCVSVLPQPVVPKGLYRLTGSTDAMLKGTIEPLAQSVTIFEPTGSDLLLGKSIVFEDDDGSLSLVAEAKWSDTLSRQLQSYMIDQLSKASGDGQSGFALSDNYGATTPFELQWEVRDMVIRKDVAIVSIRGLVSEFSSGEFRPVSAKVSQPYSGSVEADGVQALIEASREAINELSSQLTSAIALTVQD